MNRFPIAVMLAALLFISVGRTARAQETTKPEPAADAPTRSEDGKGEEAEEDPAETVLAPVTGEKVRVRIRPGVELSGVVRERRYEVFKNNRYVRAESPEEPGAGLRIFYVTGLNGFLFVRANTILEVEFSGALTREEGIKIAKRLKKEEKRAAEEKARAAEEMARRKAEAKAARDRANGGTEKTAAADSDGKPGAAGSAKEKALKMRELLVRFPPSEWTPERLDEIKRRAIVLDIFPNEEESAFIENYDLWAEGYEMWKKEQSGK